MGVSAETLTLRGGRRTGAPSIGSAARSGDEARPNDAPPVRARAVELLGSFEQSGHRVSHSLVRRADGQIVQLTPVLYEVLDAIDGHRGYDDIAAVVSERIGKIVAPQDVAFLVDTRLQPLGLLRGIDGSEPVTRKANPLLALRFRAVVTNPRVTGAIAAVFAPLFWAPLVIAFALAFVGVTGWLLLGHGVAGATRNAIYEPELLLLVFGLTTLSAGFHELGHAAACRYSGGRPGGMGVGLYLVWPAFYTDVTDSYRLDRRARLRVDLGGLYFNAIFAVAIYGLWRLTGWEALLIVIPLQGLQMVRQLIPLVRLDGYHILADITGVPDLFAHIKPILRSMLPTRWGRGDTKSLKPWVRVVVTAWVVLVVPILLGMLALIVWTLPRILATAWDSVGQSWSEVRTEAGAGDIAGAAVASLSILALAIPALSMVYLVMRVARRTGSRVWRATAGHPVRRGGALLVAAALVVAIVAAWWPRGQYTPIQPHERGALIAVDEELPIVPAAVPLEEPELTSVTLPVVDDSGDIGTPTTYELVEVGPSGEVATSTVFDSAVDERARFPFPLPPPPGIGDNQALVVNTLDGTTLIDLAISLVFTGEETVDNRNEAFALASCERCTTVAIAFQVVIIIDGNHVVIPENVAAAINAECLECITHALATQLIGTSLEPLTAAQIDELEALWSELEQLDANAATMPLDELYAELDAVQEEIETLLIGEDVTQSLAEADLLSITEASDTTLFEDDTGAIGTTPEPEWSEEAAGPSPSGSSSSEPTSSPSESPSPKPSSSPSQSPSSDPSPSSSPSSSP